MTEAREVITYNVTVTDLYGQDRSITIELHDGATQTEMRKAITARVGPDWWSAEWTSTIRDPEHEEER